MIIFHDVLQNWCMAVLACALQIPIGLIPAVASFLLPGSGYNNTGGQEGKESGKALTANGHAVT